MPKYYDSGEQLQALRLDYDVRTDDNPVYVGYAERGVSEDDLKWVLHKFTYDGSDRVTVRQVAIGSWTLRSTYF